VAAGGEVTTIVRNSSLTAPAFLRLVEGALTALAYRAGWYVFVHALSALNDNAHSVFFWYTT